jgi:hypothetical protein
LTKGSNSPMFSNILEDITVRLRLAISLILVNGLLQKPTSRYCGWVVIINNDF